jgi:hypothetical protein
VLSVTIPAAVVERRDLAARVDRLVPVRMMLEPRRLERWTVNSRSNSNFSNSVSIGLSELAIGPKL